MPLSAGDRLGPYETFASIGAGGMREVCRAHDTCLRRDVTIIVSAAKAGTLGPAIERTLADLKPEAAYFCADDSGQRTGSIVFDMNDTSQIPALWLSPGFLEFNAQVSLRPIMNAQDLAKAGPSITAARPKWAGLISRTMSTSGSPRSLWSVFVIGCDRVR